MNEFSVTLASFDAALLAMMAAMTTPILLGEPPRES